MNPAVSKQCFDSSPKSEQDYYIRAGYQIMGNDLQTVASAKSDFVAAKKTPPKDSVYITREAFEQMSPADRADYIKRGGRVF